VPDTGEGARDGAVDDGRVHPAPVLVEDDGNFVSLVVTRRECEGAEGGGDLAEAFVGKDMVSQTYRLEDSPVVPAIFEDGEVEGIWLAPGAGLFFSMNFLLMLNALNFLGGALAPEGVVCDGGEPDVRCVEVRLRRQAGSETKCAHHPFPAPRS
jgi:hypothetical protein